MKERVPTWAVFPMLFGAIALMLIGIVCILLGGAIAYDVLDVDSPKWQFYGVTYLSVMFGLGCGTASVYLIKELFTF